MTIEQCFRYYLTALREHVAKVADTLAFTIEQMAAIDAAYEAAFPGHA